MSGAPAPSPPLALAVCSSATACGPGAAEHDTARAELAKANEIRSSKLGDVRAAFARLDGVAIPGADAERCPLIEPRAAPRDPALAKLDDQIANTRAASAGELGRTIVVHAAALTGLVPATAVRVETKIAWIREQLESASALPADLAAIKKDAAEIASDAAWTHDIVVVVDPRHSPADLKPDKGTFAGGAAIGRFDAASGNMVDYAKQTGPLPRDNARYAVEVELDAQTIRAGEDALRALAR